MSECEAEGRIARTLYVLENDWGAGVFDYGKIKALLAGHDHHTHDDTQGEK